MIYSVVINPGHGNLYEGFPSVTVVLWELNNPRSQKFIGNLPPAPDLVDLYRKWQLIYPSLCDRIVSSSMRNLDNNLSFLRSFHNEEDDELEIDESYVTDISSVDFEDLCQQLELNINNWLESPGIINLSRQLRALLNPADEIRIIIETEDTIIQKLPWHCCNFFQDYPRAEISFSRTEYKRTVALQSSKIPRNHVRILAILGNSQGIDLEKERKFLQSLPDTEVELIVKPSRQQFNDKLWDSQGWDMLFFAGHSQTDGERGIIYINENPTNNSLTIAQLAEPLKAAIKKGLKIAIFNSCDGLGLANDLEKLNIPTTIVMREPVPNRVAEEFLNYFLQGFAFEKKSLYTSVQEARRRLQGLEDDFPGASWLPVIFINPAEETPTWESLKGLKSNLFSASRLKEILEQGGSNSHSKYIAPQSLEEVTELNLSAEELTALPPEIFQLSNLQTLYLYNNQLSSLAAEIIVQLSNLQTLYLYKNQLSTLPAEIGQLSNLQTLDLSRNKLSSLPAEIGQLSNLQTFDLSRNKLSSLPAEIGQQNNLQTLYLFHNKLSSFPAGIGQLTNLQNLYLSSNKLSSLPAEIGQLSNVQNLYLNSNELSSLPAEIGQLSNLQILDIGSNQLSSLPAEIGQLSNLQILNLGSNQLSSLPAEIGQLSNLQILNLGSNKLSSLPVEIGQLSNLQILDIGSNQLSSLPAEIGQLSNLQILNLGSNKLSSLPAEIGDLHLCLSELKLYGNLLESLPLEIRSQGTQAILNFYKQQLEQTIDRLYEAKLLIIGEGGAGKTSLAKKIENETYELNPKEESTEGIDVIQWKFPLSDGKEFRVNIWDFGGQEIYHQTHQFFLTERSLYALVTDSRSENTNFYWWMKIAEILSNKSPILIVKNEKQERKCEVYERQLRGEFTNLKEILATNLAKNRGLEEIKKSIRYHISNLSHVGTELPKIWVEIRSAIEKDTRNYISREEYYQLCKKHNLTNPEDMLWLSGYLHDLGVFLHFQKDSTLKHCVILKPKWATTAVYKVLDNKTVKENLGCFNQDQLADIWKDSEYSDMRDELLQLMMRFKLCYQIPNRPGNYIAPQLLDNEELPDYTWDKSNNLILRYKYEFMPKGIITRFIVETHPWIEQQKLVWRSGVVLNQDETRAELIEYYNQREIKVRVSGNRKKELLAVVNHELEKIHRSFERLQYQTLVPCYCSECMTSENPYAFPLKNLYKHLKKGKYQIECQDSLEDVDVRRLIDHVNLLQQKTQLQGELQRERNLNLTGKQREKLRDVIITAYPNKAKLEMMVNYELDENLHSIVEEKNNMNYIVFQLIEWAKSTNQLEKLIDAACESNPNNQELQSIREEFFHY